MTDILITPETFSTIPVFAMKDFKKRFPKSYRKIAQQVFQKKQTAKAKPLPMQRAPKISINFTSDDLYPDIIVETPRSKIIKNCGLLTDVSWPEIISERRERRIVVVRHVVMYLMHEYSEWSLPRIGKMVGRRDHTTVLHGVRQVKKWLAMSRTERDKWSKDYGPALTALEGLLKRSGT